MPKNNEKMRVRINFTDLEKACPKDSFPLPHIDSMVDAIAGHEMLSSLDAFSGYNKNLMHLNDEEKISFISERGTYCYKRIPFGVKECGSHFSEVNQQNVL